MDDEKRTFTSVDEYVEAAPYDVESRLVEMRRIIRAALPGAKERISHGIPAYEQNGVVVTQFAGSAEHTSLSFFPTAGVFAAFSDELAAYRTTRSAIRFRVDEPLPAELIGAITRFRLAESTEFVARRTAGK